MARREHSGPRPHAGTGHAAEWRDCVIASDGLCSLPAAQQMSFIIISKGRGFAPPFQNSSIDMRKAGHIGPVLRNGYDKRSVGADDSVRPND